MDREGTQFSRVKLLPAHAAMIVRADWKTLSQVKFEPNGT